MDQTEFAVTPANAAVLIERCIAARRPAMLWGAPGVGKSDIIAQIARKQDRPVIDMRLLIMEPTDIKGIPFYCPESNTMRWARPGELPGKDETELHNAILFLDEITAAPASVQAAAYQLILNRRVGTYALPEGVDVLAAGNRVADRAVSNHMPSALKNRFVHFTLKTSFDDWMVWAVENKIHEDIVGYLKQHPHNLFNFDPKSSDHAFATPRSWAFVNDLYDPHASEHINRQLVAGTVGQGLATEFMAHVRLRGQLPDAADILAGRVKELPKKDVGPSALYSLTVSLCYRLSELRTRMGEEGHDVNRLDQNDQWNQALDNFLTFIMDNMSAEMAIMSTIVAMRTYKLPINVDSDAFDRFYQKYGKYLTTSVCP